MQQQNSMGASGEHRLVENVMRASSDVMCALDPQGRIRHVNVAAQRVLGYEASELVGQFFAHFVHPDGRLAAQEMCQRAQQQAEPVVFETRCRTKNGQDAAVAWSAFRAPGEADLLLCVGHPAPSERRQALDHTLIEHGFDMVALLDEQGVYTYVGGSTAQALGYPPEQLLGRSAFDYIHPDDLGRVQAYWEQLGAQPVITVPDFRFRAANGAWKWVETTLSNQLENPEIRAYVVSSRDVTERKQSGVELFESEQRFRLLFENNPALTAFQTTDGRVLDANPALLAFFKKEKHEVVNQLLVDFLPLELRPLFGQKLRETVGGQSVRFETQMEHPEEGLKTLNVTQIPLVVAGEVVGVHVVAKDITEISAAQRLIKRQAEQLTTTLESITDGFVSLDRNWNLTYINREAERMLSIRREDCLGQSVQAIFPEDDNEIYYRHGQQAFKTGATTRFETFSLRTSRWLDVKLFPSPDGLSVYVADITDRVEAEKQLKLLALVAQGTDNGVIITDARGRTEWVNAGFTKHTGYVLDDLVGRPPGAVLQGPETDPATILRIRERLKLGAPFSVTILNYKKSGQKLWYSMDITPIYSEAGELTQFVALLQNINYRKEIEASQAKMTQDLYRHNRDLQQFTYVISHNLRAPLANGLGLATMLAKVDKNSEVFDTSLAHLRNSMRQVDTVLRDLNMVLSIRDQQDVQVPEPVALAEVCQQAIDNLAEPLRHCAGQVTVDVEPGLLVRGNRAYLYSIFYNLLSNSIKYRSEERALEVSIKCLPEEGGGTSISFTDNGSGFDMYKAGSDVFQLYKRFHTNQRGRGIGLFLVKTHVEAMGGQIEVASGVNFGTRFLIHLDKR